MNSTRILQRIRQLMLNLLMGGVDTLTCDKVVFTDFETVCFALFNLVTDVVAIRNIFIFLLYQYLQTFNYSIFKNYFLILAFYTMSILHNLASCLLRL